MLCSQDCVSHFYSFYHRRNIMHPDEMRSFEHGSDHGSDRAIHPLICRSVFSVFRQRATDK